MSHSRWIFVWTALLLGTPLLFAVLFAYFEELAFKTGGLTLSRFIWNLSQSFPLFPYMLGLFEGLLLGGLAVHFWWHWLPPGANSSG